MFYNKEEISKRVASGKTTKFLFNKSMIYLLTSCNNTEERIAQNIYIHNSNKNYKRIDYNNKINQETDRHRITVDIGYSSYSLCLSVS